MANLSKIYHWLKVQKKKQKISIKKKDLSELELWHFDSEKIFHSSKHR